MKKVGFVIFCLVSLLVIQDLLRSIVTLWQKRDVLTMKQEELTKAKSEYQALQEKEKAVSDPRFAEGEIRNKLFLVKPDEKVVVLPTDMPGKGGESSKNAEQEGHQQAVYEQWLTLFRKGSLD